VDGNIGVFNSEFWRKRLAQATVQTVYCRLPLRRVEAHRMCRKSHELVECEWGVYSSFILGCG